MISIYTAPRAGLAGLGATDTATIAANGFVRVFSMGAKSALKAAGVDQAIQDAALASLQERARRAFLEAAAAEPESPGPAVEEEAKKWIADTAELVDEAIAQAEAGTLPPSTQPAQAGFGVGSPAVAGGLAALGLAAFLAARALKNSK